MMRCTVWRALRATLSSGSGSSARGLIVPALTRGIFRQAATPAAASTSAFKLAASLLAAGTGLGLACGAATASASAERTFIAIKPDGVHRGLISEIIKRFESKGYKLVGIKLLVPTAELAGSHYAEHEGRPFFPKLVNFLSSGPVLAMVWEGKDVIKTGRQMIGATNPLTSAPGTIRGDYGIDVGRNIIHGSDSVASAQREIALWFKPDELANWSPVTSTWVYE